MTQWNKYDPTAARPRGKPGREIRPKSITVDFHSHVGVPQAAELVKPYLATNAMPLVTFANEETRTLNAKQEGDIAARSGLDKRLADSMPWASTCKWSSRRRPSATTPCRSRSR